MMLCFSLVSTSWAEDDATVTMSLKECVILALGEAYNLKIQNLDQAIAAAQLGAARASYDPVLTASVSFSDVTAPGGIDTRTGSFEQSETQTYNASAQITGLLPSGGQYTIGASAVDTEGTRGPFEFSNASGQGPFINLRQPLLENLAIDDTRLNIRVSAQNLHVATLMLTLAMLETVNRVEDAYYNLLAARKSVSVQEEALKLAEELWKENETRVTLGALAPIEAAEARSQASAAKASLLVAQQQTRVAQNVLKGVMVEDFAKWQGITIHPIGALTRSKRPLVFRESWVRALRLRPDLQSLQVQLEQRHLIERRRRNQLLPELDLTASAGVAGTSSELSGVYDQIRDRDAPYYSLGLSLALPLTNRRERENHRLAQMEIEQAKLRLRQQRQALMIQIDDAVNQAKTDFERIAATREAREYAAQALTNEQAKLARGASTDFVVLQLQRNLTAAQSDEIRSQADYSKSLSRLRLLEGGSLETHDIMVEAAPLEPTIVP